MSRPQAAGTTNRNYRLRDDKVAWRRAGDEAVVLDLLCSNFHALNAAGTLLWERLGEWTTAEQLAAMLVESFAITPDVAANDIERFLAECADLGLLQVDPNR